MLRSFIVSWLLTWAMAWASLGCGSKGDPEGCQSFVTNRTLCLDPTCVADPTAHRVVMEGCASSRECPSGARCLPSTEEIEGEYLCAEGVGTWVENKRKSWCATRAGAPSACLETCSQETCSRQCSQDSCQLPDPDADHSNALIGGFNTGSFDIMRGDSTGAASFSWNTPKEAHIVACALFGCVPEFRKTSEFQGTDIIRIVNYDQCVLAKEEFTSVDAVFSLGSIANQYSPSSSTDLSSVDTGTCEPSSSSPRALTHLLVGCWAYDETVIIGATELEHVSPHETSNYHDIFGSDGDPWACSEEERESCHLGAQRGYGTCFHGQCRPRCIKREDCVKEMAFSPLAQRTSCLVPEGELVGICASPPR